MPSQFEDFALSPAVLRGLASLGFERPTLVQEHAIPLLLDGLDAIVQAKTGSGKTLAFGLPVLSLLDPGPIPQALVLVPTRELAIQVCESIQAVNTDNLRVGAIYGGVGYGPQEAALKAGIDLLVGTPGRLKDLLERGSLNLKAVRILILDEADKMLDMGFRRDIDYVLHRLPSREQTLIFSATMPPDIEAIARKHLKNPEIVKLISQEAPPDISHFFLRVGRDRRTDALIALLEADRPERAIVFTRTKHETKRLAQKLEKLAGIPSGYLNGNMSQNARNTMLARFRSGELSVLVATDVAARGLDVEGLSHVFHYAVPTVVETYVHRSGRTGRNGASGQTVIFVTPEEEGDFKAIAKQVHCSPLDLDLASLPIRDVRSAEADAREERFGQNQGQRRGRGEQRAPQGRAPQASASASAQEVVLPGFESEPARGRNERGARRRDEQPAEARSRGERGRPTEAAPAPRAQDGRGARGQEAAKPARGPKPGGPRAAEAPLGASEREDSRRRRALPPSVTNPKHDASSLLNTGPREARSSTGPLAPLPRHETTWRKFKLALAPGHRQTRDSLHSWLSRNTGVARSSIRSIAIHPDHATVEVELRSADRFLKGLSGKALT